MPLILLNKPYQVLSQFRDAEGRRTLAEFVTEPGVYPAGRLDYDSEGLIALTDDGRLQAAFSAPDGKLAKTYWAQVEGDPQEEQLDELLRGVRLKDGSARALTARVIDEPAGLWPRDPPIRYRKNVAEVWLEIRIATGRNRQVRRMTAAAGLPTLRLIRAAIGPWSIDALRPGESRRMENDAAWRDVNKHGQQ